VRLGETIRDFRSKKNLTQEQLAFKSGLSRNYISLIELDEKSPTLQTLSQICKALDVKVSALLIAAERKRDRAE
jgi:transcriptional regulator with XRE-family HTH domain